MMPDCVVQQLHPIDQAVLRFRPWSIETSSSEGCLPGEDMLGVTRSLGLGTASTHDFEWPR